MMVGPHRLHPIPRRPPFLPSGSIIGVLPRTWIERRNELAVSIAFVGNRPLFGQTYAQLQPEFFWDMKRSGGVFVALCVPTSKLCGSARKPGDVDILVVPYDSDHLMLDRVLAIEVKIIRASYERQGRSPNDFGFSQADGLREMGFPYVGLIHLVVSDDGAPEHEWTEMMQARILDREGRVELMPPVMVDTLPMRLVQRAFGRLDSRRPFPELGLGAAFIAASNWDQQNKEPSVWTPTGAAASLNEKVDEKLLRSVAAYFDGNFKSFLDTPARDPE